MLNIQLLDETTILILTSISHKRYTDLAATMSGHLTCMES